MALKSILIFTIFIALISNVATAGQKSWLELNPSGKESSCNEAKNICFNDMKTDDGGKTKVLKTLPKKIKVLQFAFWFQTTNWNPDESSGKGTTSHLDLDKTLALAATDAAYKRFQEKFKAAGYELSVLDPAKIEANGEFKDEKENGAKIENGSVTDWSYGKMASDGPGFRIIHATGVNAVNMGAKAGAKTVDVWNELTEKDQELRAFINIQFDFSKQSSGFMVGGTSFKTEPNLTMYNQVHFGTSSISTNWDGNYAYLALQDPRIRYTKADWVKAIKQKEELYGASFTYSLDPEKFKAATLAIADKYIEQALQSLENFRK